jgi:Ca2+-transporting ATPase
MAFMTLTLAQLFNVFNARSDRRTAFAELFANHWLWAALALALVLNLAVIYLPFMQQGFSTVSLSLSDWLKCAAAASSVLWLRELSKLVIRRVKAGQSAPSSRGSATSRPL